MSAQGKQSAEYAEKSIPLLIDDRLLAGLALLWQAWVYAEDAGEDLWDFALQARRLYDAGLTISDLRWLVAKGFAEHGQETSVYGEPHRSFRRGDGFFFDNATCLVLTTSGTALAENLLKGSAVSLQASPTTDTSSIADVETAASPNEPPTMGNTNGSSKSTRKPHWDPSRRVLSLFGTTVKRYRVPAPNQETILNAFEEEGWPPHIDDPLPVNDEIDPPTRLHDTINRLNRHQKIPLIRFHGNGYGNGVSWEIRQPNLKRQNASSGVANK